MWEDHYAYLDRPGRLLSDTPLARLVIVGDVNQRIRQDPRRSLLASALHDAVSSRRTVATAALGWDGRHAIDRVAVGRDLHCEAVGVIGSAHGGWRLSDHFGVFADVLAREDA